jgi:hypothetical protein
MSIIGDVRGWTISKDRDEIGIETFSVPDALDVRGNPIRLPLRREVAPLLLEAARRFHHEVENLNPVVMPDDTVAQCWGWAVRDIRGGSSWSFHAPGIAVDLNSWHHPIGVSPERTMNSRQREACRRIARDLHLRWGGDFSRPDGMHFEYYGTPDELADDLKRLPQTKPEPPKEWDELATEEQIQAAAKAGAQEAVSGLLTMVGSTVWGHKLEDMDKAQRTAARILVAARTHAEMGLRQNDEIKKAVRAAAAEGGTPEEIAERVAQALGVAKES